MPQQSTIAVVRAWQDAANAQNMARITDLSDPDIEIVGPRGSGRGHALLREWLGRAGLSLQTRRIFARADAVVFTQHAVWRSGETGAVVGEREVASFFRVDGGRVARVARYDDLDQALREAGLTSQDEVIGD